MTVVLFLLALACFLVALFASVSRHALREFSLHDLGQLAEQHGRHELLGTVLRWQERLEVAADIVRATSLATGGALATTAWIARRAAPGQQSWLSSMAFAVALIVAAVVVDVWLAIPVARLWSTRILFHCWPGLHLAGSLLLPLVLVTKAVEFFLFRVAGRAPQPPSEETLEDEIRTIVTEGQREGLLEEDAREMIEGVIELGDVNVSDVMTPRTDMLTLHVSTALAEAAQFFVTAGHSRIPIYDKNRDDLVGILYIKDLVAELIKEPGQRTARIADLMRPPVFVPESKPLDDLLQEFQGQRTHMAIVLNEFGSVAGLVTIEDILEEIVGEIVDEHDEEIEQEIRRIDEHTCDVPARTRLEDINDELGLDLQECGVDTIGGFVFSELGHVPKPGEQVVWKNVRLTVLDVKHRRVERVRVEILNEAPSEHV
jgi:CBS domain containing-hemolysin-like protein